MVSLADKIREAHRWAENVRRIPLAKADAGTQQFASWAVGRTPDKQAPAAWTLDKTTYVQHVRNSVHIAIGAIARKMAMQEIAFYRRKVKRSGVVDEPLKWNHPIAELFREVNPRMTEWELWYYTEGWKLSTGDSYWWKARNGFGTPKQIWPVPSQWVWAIPSPTEFIGAYRVESFFLNYGRFAEIPASEVVQISEPNLDWSGNGRFYGSPPLVACANTVDIEQAMFTRLYHTFRNYAPPAVILATMERLTDSQLRQIYNQIVNQHSLAEHTGRPMILHSGLEPKYPGGSGSGVREMDYGKSLDATLTLTMAVFGTPRAVVGLVQDANRCLDEKTECLTADGWKRYDELTADTKIACYDSASQTIRYEKPTNRFVTQYDGDLLHWKSQVADIMVTPNHRIYAKPGDRDVDRNGPWHFRLAEEWEQASRLRILSTAPQGAACDVPQPMTLDYPQKESTPVLVLDGPDVSVVAAAKLMGVARNTIQLWISNGTLDARKVKTGQSAEEYRIRRKDLMDHGLPAQGGPTHRGDVMIDADDWLEFLGWFVSEGSTSVRRHYRKNCNGRSYKSTQYTVFLSQRPGDNADQIQALLDRMPLKWNRCLIGKGKRQIQWTCFDKGLHDHLVRHCGKGAKSKRVPSYVKAYPAKSLQVLMNAAIEGDGHRAVAASGKESTITYTTISKQLANDFHELAIKCGWRASLRTESRKTVTGNTVYTLNILPNRHDFKLRNSKHLRRVKYSGPVWCVETSTGLFVVRRNGKVHVTGNSNMVGAMIAFAENVINPRLIQNAKNITYGIARDFEPDGSIIAKFPPCTVNDAEDLRKAIESASKAGAALTPNEIRELLFRKTSYEVGGDRPLLGGGMTEAFFGNDPDVMDEKELELQTGMPPQVADEANQLAEDVAKMEAVLKNRIKGIVHSNGKHANAV